MINRKRFLIPGILVLLILVLTPIPALAIELIGNYFAIANEGNLSEVQPSIAYNSQRKHYLVVWSNDRAGNDDIRAQKVALDGSLIGGPFYISAGTGHDRWKPDVTYDSVQDQYLVVWEDFNNNTPAIGYSICARRVSGSGILLDTSDIFISGPGSNLYTPSAPAVAFASGANRYLVVWHEVTHVGTPTHYIYSQVVTPQGALEGAATYLSNSTKIHSAPDLAYNPRENRYMVAWQEYNSSTSVYDVKGQQVVGNGNLYGTVITYGPSGKAHEGPAVAALPNDANDLTYIITWIVTETGLNGYGFQYTDRFGTSLTWYNILMAPAELSHIALAVNPNSETYLVAYQDDRGSMDKSIYLRLFDRETHGIGSFRIPGPANDFPAIAVGQTGDYLVAWQGQPLSLTHTNIYGQIIGNRYYLPLIMK